MGIHYYILIILQITSYGIFEAYPIKDNATLAFEILHDRNELLQDPIIKSLWEREPSEFCNIVKPTEKNLVEKKFVDFNFVSVLCMILYDVSLRYMELNVSPGDLNLNFTQIIHAASADTFCREMEKNNWVTTVDKNKPWVSYFDEIMKKKYLCARYCVTDTVNPLCALVLGFDLLEKKAEHLKNSDNLKVSSAMGSRLAVSPAVTKQTDDAHTPPVRNEIPKLDTKAQNQDQLSLRTNNDQLGAKNVGHIPESSNTGVLSNAPNIQEYQRGSRPFPDDSIANVKSETAGHSLIGSSYGSTEKNTAKQKSTIKTSTTNSQFISGSDILKPGVNLISGLIHEESQLPKGGTTSINLSRESVDLKSVSKAPGKVPDEKLGEVKFSKEPLKDTQSPPISVSDNKKVGATTKPNVQQTGFQKINKTSPAVLPADPESVPRPEHREKSNSESVNTTDAVVKEKAKTEVSKEHPTEVSKLPPLPDQIGGSEIEEENHANEPEFDGESPLEPEDHEDQKKMDDGVMGSQMEEGIPGSLGGVHPPQEPEDDLADQQDSATEEPRFEDEDPPPKPDPSTKVVADYGGASDEDDDMWHPDGRVTQNDADAGFSRDRYIDEEDSHFFAYFMTMIILCILGYLIFHNKQKILALALEGRVRKGSRRRPSTSGYRKLDSNLEEAVTSNCTGSSVTHVIY